MKFSDCVRCLAIFEAVGSVINFAIGNEISAIWYLLMAVTILLFLIEEKLSNGN